MSLLQMHTKQQKQIIIIVTLLFGATIAHPLCVNGDGPQKPAVPLEICTDYNDTGCCTIDTETIIRAELEASMVVNAQCRTMLQQILCSKCDSWAAHLFDAEGETQAKEVPFLCTDYCGELWNACQSVAITGNPFDDQKRAISLGELYSTQTSFCAAYKTNSGQYCYSGKAFTPTVITDSNFTSTVCVERMLESPTYLVMAVTPVEEDNRLFFGTQSGKINVYDKETQAITGIFLDISGKTFINGETGLHGLAFHPDYKTNGLFYVAYSCNPSDNNCLWKCDRGCPFSGCNADGYCDILSHIQIIEEFKVADGDWSSNTADPNAVRRILEYPHPWANHNAGDLHFGPDGYLYTTTGDGGNQDDPLYSSQNLASILGKVLRIDVNSKADGKEYGVPNDNPFFGNDGAMPEIWAYGFRNPYRFSFDKTTGKLWVGDVGGAKVEEIDIIEKGGNYGWSRYEGNEVHRADKPQIANHMSPVMSYYRTFIDPACVVGGYVYRADINPCLHGTYIFADYFGVLIQGKEVVPNSGVWNIYKIKTQCAASSPKTCRSLDTIFSFGQDRNGDMFILTKDAVFKIVDASKCGLTCTEEANVLPPNLSQTPITPAAPKAATPEKPSAPTIIRQSESAGSIAAYSFAPVVLILSLIYVY